MSLVYIRKKVILNIPRLRPLYGRGTDYLSSKAAMGYYTEAKSAYTESIDFTPDGLDYQAPIIGLKELEDE